MVSSASMLASEVGASTLRRWECRGCGDRHGARIGRDLAFSWKHRRAGFSSIMMMTVWRRLLISERKRRWLQPSACIGPRRRVVTTLIISARLLSVCLARWQGFIWLISAWDRCTADRAACCRARPQWHSDHLFLQTGFERSAVPLASVSGLPENSSKQMALSWVRPG